MNYLSILLFFIYVALPLFFLFRMWRNCSKNFTRWLLEVFAYGVYILNIFLVGIWPMSYGYFFRYPLIIAFVIVAIKSFFNVKRTFVLKPFGLKKVFLSLINLSVISFFIWEIFLALSGTFCPKEFVSLEFPLKRGSFYIAHGGANQIINHHYPVSAQRYALDIVRLNSFGVRTNKWSANELKDFCIFGCTVYSPCYGTVLESVDQYEDLKPAVMDPEHVAGNYLAIAKKDSEIVVFLAHLMQGSLLVKKGDSVQVGQPIARVGNTGNTSEPHLHMHAVLNHTGNFLFTGKGIPMKFNNRFLTRNDRFY